MAQSKPCGAYAPGKCPCCLTGAHVKRMRAHAAKVAKGQTKQPKNDAPLIRAIASHMESQAFEPCLVCGAPLDAQGRGHDDGCACLGGA